RLEHRNVGVVAIEANGSVGPFATDRVTADDRETEVGEEGDRGFEVANGDADILKFDGHARHAIEPADADPRPQAPLLLRLPGGRSAKSVRDSDSGGVTAPIGRNLAPRKNAAHRKRRTGRRKPVTSDRYVSYASLGVHAAALDEDLAKPFGFADHQTVAGVHWNEGLYTPERVDVLPLHLRREGTISQGQDPGAWNVFGHTEPRHLFREHPRGF